MAPSTGGRPWLTTEAPGDAEATVPSATDEPGVRTGLVATIVDRGGRGRRAIARRGIDRSAAPDRRARSGRGSGGEVGRSADSRVDRRGATRVGLTRDGATRAIGTRDGATRVVATRRMIARWTSVGGATVGRIAASGPRAIRVTVRKARTIALTWPAAAATGPGLAVTRRGLAAPRHGDGVARASARAAGRGVIPRGIGPIDRGGATRTVAESGRGGPGRTSRRSTAARCRVAVVAGPRLRTRSGGASCAEEQRSRAVRASLRPRSTTSSLRTRR